MQRVAGSAALGLPSRGGFDAVGVEDVTTIPNSAMYGASS